jgi:hypothetical protein
MTASLLAATDEKTKSHEEARRAAIGAQNGTSSTRSGT